ncbi:MAG: hypothetical protein ACI8PZ_000381 [Myxococcota bacterium]|jgi:hypothetical protein
MRYIVLAALSLPAAALAAPTLTLSGACPGVIDIDIAGLTPGGEMTLLFSGGEGADVLPAGACSGLATGLSPIRFGLRAPDVDGDGTMSFGPSVPEGACGTHVQILDPATCELSPVRTLGEADAPGDLIYGAVGECSGGNLYSLDTTTGEETVVCGLSNGYSGLAFDDAGNLFGAADTCSGGDLWSIDIDTCTETLHTALALGETGLAFANGLLYFVDTSTTTHEIDPVSGASVDLGFSSASCCAADIAGDADGTMWYADSGIVIGFVDLASGAKADLWSFAEARQGITFHNGMLVGLNGGCAELFGMNTVDGSTTPLGVAFSDCSLDAIASPTP